MKMKTTKHNFFSRGIVALLSVLMCFGAFSMTAFSSEDTSADTPQRQQTSYNLPCCNARRLCSSCRD